MSLLIGGQEWLTRRKEPAVELPESQAKELSSPPVLDLDQAILLTPPAPDPPEVEENGHDISDIIPNVIPQLDGPAETFNDIMVTLELNDIGDIVGPELAPNSSPPARVFHPKAGIGILEEEQSVRPDDEDQFFSYLFPDDPNAYVVTQGPNRGQKMESIMEVFLCS